jgi:multiple sugar transport system permease protein
VPWLIPGSAAVLLWLWIFYEPGGVLSLFVVEILGPGAAVNWLGSGKLAFSILVTFNIWRELPFWSVVFWAARARVPEQLIEDYKLFERSKFKRETELVLPLLRPTVMISLALMFMWSMGEFQAVHLLTRGGPARSTQTVAYYAYEVGLGGGIDLSLAIAAMLTVLPIAGIIVVPLLEFGIAQSRLLQWKR